MYLRETIIEETVVDKEVQKLFGMMTRLSKEEEAIEKDKEEHACQIKKDVPLRPVFGTICQQ